MSLSEEDIQLIESYLEGNLQKEENILFHVKMQQRPFSEEVALRESIVRSLRGHYQNELKNELNRHLIKNRETLKIGRATLSLKNRKYLAIAASISIIFVVLLFFLKYNKAESSEELFAMYYKPYPVATPTRGDNEFITPAFEKYREGNYQEASVLLEGIIVDEKLDDPFLQLIVGNCYLNTNRFDKALIAFQTAMNSNELILKQHAKWYMALTLLKINKIDQSMAVLEQIRNADSFYSKNAASLIEGLKKEAEN